MKVSRVFCMELGPEAGSPFERCPLQKVFGTEIIVFLYRR